MRVLITGMSGVGKSTVVRELAARGYRAVDLEDPALGLSEPREHGTWDWRVDRVRELLASDPADVLVIAGTSQHQTELRSELDLVILLSAPCEVLLDRLASRTTNDFGKDPDERRRILEDLEQVEPLLRRAADLEIDTTAPLDDVVGRIVAELGH